MSNLQRLMQYLGVRGLTWPCCATGHWQASASPQQQRAARRGSQGGSQLGGGCSPERQLRAGAAARPAAELRGVQQVPRPLHHVRQGQSVGALVLCGMCLC